MRFKCHDFDDGDVPAFGQWLVGERTGIIQGVDINFPDRSDPDIVSTQLEFSDLHTLPPEREGDFSFSVGGKGLSINESLTRCLGEAVERYSSYFPDYEGMIKGSYRELVANGRNIVDIQYLDVYEKSQYENLSKLNVLDESFDEDTVIRWCEGTNLITGETIYVPSQLVYMGVAEETTCLIGSSNGSACHTSLQSALLNAIRESVERDAFMKTWLQQRVPRKAATERVAPAHQLKTTLENDFVQYHVFRFKTDIGFHALGCAAVNKRDESPKFVLGGAASLDVSGAIVDALLEAAQGWQYGKFLTTEYDLEQINLNEIVDFERNVAYYAHPSNFDDIQFLLSGEEWAPETNNAGDNLQQAVRVLDRNGYTPIAFELTTRDVREAGLRVTKVYLPEMVDLALPSFPPRNHPEFEGSTISDKPHPYP